MAAETKSSKLSRRHLMLAAGGAIATGAVAGTAGRLFSAGGEAAPSVGELARRVKGYRRHYVVPTALDRFTEERRLELDILGPQLAALSCTNEQCRAPGFMAWLEPVAATRLLAEKDIREVYDLTPNDVQVIGAPKDAHGQLNVVIAPNGWGAPPKPQTFLSATDLAQQWQEELKEYAPVTVTGHEPNLKLPANAPQRRPGAQLMQVSLRVQFEDPNVPDKAVQLIKTHPQTTQMFWLGVIKQLQPGFGDGCPGCGLG